MVQTYNDDKNDRLAIYSLTLKTPATLIVLMDTRAESGVAWLKNGFERTDEIVTTNFDFQYRVYRKDVDPGTVNIGSQNGASHYALAALKIKD